MDELACFSETSRQRAFQHFELLRAHLEDGRPLAAIARETSLSYRTLQYWAKVLLAAKTYGSVFYEQVAPIDRSGEVVGPVESHVPMAFELVNSWR